MQKKEEKKEGVNVHNAEVGYYLKDEEEAFWWHSTLRIRHAALFCSKNTKHERIKREAELLITMH